MNILGLDYGKKRIGVSFSEGTLAYPLPTIIVEDKKSVLQKISSIIEENRVTKIIFGLPSPDRIGAYDFAHVLQEKTCLEVELRDETLTSVNALDKLRLSGKKRIKKADIDAASATLLLQEYLDEQNQI
ncbi:MAG: hypothetical protein A3F33_02815 [Candidatus Woykebacteria bacterium RIFCSPHIGHO2_12_FULL_43_10]|uniref:Putative pre-16S rRNA nuclease n=2 Tax=Candidatus Woykeibacteriota TaxID=1817899 RepID=A0A1G1WYM6_9BACT|nr:MAG: hypothetical protein A2802_01440 [Candidatus Woykebacteria bacterium RIFCSPHIGHO2_01_FULL_43_29]OGY28680.1 MAG: hypothetical protein A3J50_01020 [Candidatus Woykebacteria bacterium RIFCSPHIGHO2_02_FULL_43_16b]OGY29756.1 MAG: hypothetical protein A3F33_02815 [Candidatus Woykebacteria bacterium RIFCSPHIGHO2_12_FULL_43_10]OGY32430.1 MAG: hypothetical protein A3A61_00545 [Candidatus Woykebacteria bacterium RIFCSPLOWO2_01_FULL_43_14]